MLHCKNTGTSEGSSQVLNIRSETMTTATLRIATPLVESPAPAKKGVLARFYDALIAARMRKAMREIEHHRHLLPEHPLKSAGYEATVRNDGTLPFTR
jgi:hypothetical protein